MTSTARAVFCNVVLFCTSALLLGLFAYSTVELVRQTPMYKPLVCTELPLKLGHSLVSGSWIKVSGRAERACQNPNTHARVVVEESAGVVYANSSGLLKPVGHSSPRRAVLEAGAAGVSMSELDIALPSADPEALALLGRPVFQVITEASVRTSVSSSFLGLAFKRSETARKVCGFELRIAPRKAGPSACADDVANLVIPQVDDETPTPKIEEVRAERQAAQAQQTALAWGAATACSGVMAIVLLVLGVKRARQLRSNASSADESRLVSFAGQEQPAIDV